MTKKTFIPGFILLFTLFSLTGCSSIGDKSASMSIIYASAAVLALLLLIGYCALIPKKDIWYLLLFTSIFVVNIGYFSLSVSRTLEEALLANRISYLGSVFLPTTMLMLIMNVAKLKYKKWVPGLLFVLGVVVFLVAASPGYSNLYYKEVYIDFSHGVTTLQKVYGPLHCIYLYYLLTYFAVMIGITLYTIFNHKMATKLQSVILAGAVFVNLAVWLFEQLVQIEFEILSLSYIICELFLLSLQIIIMETEKAPATDAVAEPIPVSPEVPAEHTATPLDSHPDLLADSECAPADNSETADTPSLQDCLEQYQHGLSNLTPTEHLIFECYIAGKTTKEIMAELNIKENTLKFHNKNLYGKLGVSSRKQLRERYKQLEPDA